MIKSLKTQVENVNAFGRQNLNAKGVATNGDETTYQIMSKIADILSESGDNSIVYSNIVYNEDGTVTLTETNGTVHTMTCEYDGDKLVGLKYDNEVINLTYKDDVLVGIGGTEVDVSNAPYDTRLKDIIEGTSTELVDDTIISVREGAFYYSTLQKIDLLNCETVGKNAFTSAKMTSLNLPNCTSVASNGFSSCSSLTSLNLPKCTTVGNSGFSGCSAMTSLVLPNCESIGESGFAGCSKLKTLELPKVKTIKVRCFYGCKALDTLIIRTEGQVATVGASSGYTWTNTPISSGKGYIYVPDDLVEDYKIATNWSNYANQIKGLSELEVVSNE